MSERTARTPLRLLHVEDNPVDSELIHAALESAGYAVDVLRVETADATREALARGGFDLVMSDFSLPRYNGLEALVMATEVAPDLPFILVSGTIGEEAAIESLRSGATDYVLKHRLSRLAPAVRRALKEAEDRRVLRDAERALVRERHFLRAVLESVRTGIIACDGSGTLTLFNRAAREIYGVAADTPLSQVLAERFWLLDDHGNARIARLDAPLQRILSGEEISDTEQVVVPRGRPRRRVVLSGRVVADDRREKLGAVVALHDVSEQRNLVEQLRHAQKMEAVGRLVGGVAQDFNNLLTAIAAYAQLASRRMLAGGEITPELAEIERTAARGGALTRQLLAFSRTEVGQPRSLDLNAVIGEIEPVLGRVLGDAITLEVRLDAEPSPVFADPAHLEQIVLTLLVHAIDSMPAGGRVVIETHAAEPGAGPPMVLLSIGDNGEGMDEEQRARLFAPAFADREGAPTTNLGLATVHGIVHQCGGTIEVESAPGAGTRFLIRFPRAENPVRRPARPRPRAAERGSGHILVVERDSAVRSVIVRALRMQGYTVVEASGRSEVSQVIDTSPLDLMIADHGIGVASLVDLASRLAQCHPPIRTLFLCGPESGAATAAAIEGARHLPKPFTVDELIRQVRDQIAGPPAEAA